MFKQLFKISEFVDAMEDGIVCLVDQDDKGRIRFGYYTTNEHLLSHFVNDDAIDAFIDMNDEKEQTETIGYSILEGDFERLEMHIFEGKVFAIATIQQPVISAEPGILKLNEKKFVDNKGNHAELINVINGVEDFNLVFQVSSESGVDVSLVNELGIDKDGVQTILNRDSSVGEVEGYMFIAKKHNPVFLNKEESKNVALKGKALLLPAIAVVEGGTKLKQVSLVAHD